MKSFPCSTQWDRESSGVGEMKFIQQNRCLNNLLSTIIVELKTNLCHFPPTPRAVAVCCFLFKRFRFFVFFSFVCCFCVSFTFVLSILDRNLVQQKKWINPFSCVRATLLFIKCKKRLQTFLWFMLTRAQHIKCEPTTAQSWMKWSTRIEEKSQTCKLTQPELIFRGIWTFSPIFSPLNIFLNHAMEQLLSYWTKHPSVLDTLASVFILP